MMQVYEISALAQFSNFSSKIVKHKQLILNLDTITDKFLKDWEKRIIEATKDNYLAIEKLTDFKITKLDVI